MIDQDKIGTEIEAFCKKCKEDTGHIITSIKNDQVTRVMCNSCHSTHKYIAAGMEIEAKSRKKVRPKSTKDPKKVKAPRAKRLSKLDLWNKVVGESDANTAISYAITNNYEVNNLISHGKFGLGIVQKVHSSRKIQVLFEEGEKLLVQNWN